VLIPVPQGALRWGTVPAQRGGRTDEHGAAARVGRDRHAADAEKILPADRRLKALSKSVGNSRAGLATAMLTLLGLQAVILFDLATFAAGLCRAALGAIPRVKAQEGPRNPAFSGARGADVFSGGTWAYST
jgi:hypothetical protein